MGDAVITMDPRRAFLREEFVPHNAVDRDDFAQLSSTYATYCSDLPVKFKPEG